MPALTILPTAAASDPALSPGALRVLIALPSTESAPVRVSQLTASLALSRSTVYRAIRVLRDRHYLLCRLAAPGEYPGTGARGVPAPRHVYRVNLLRYQERSA